MRPEPLPGVVLLITECRAARPETGDTGIPVRISGLRRLGCLSGKLRRLGTTMRTHPPIVSYEFARPCIVGQIDTQQLPWATMHRQVAAVRAVSRQLPPWHGMSGHGHQIFTDALTRFAARTADSGLAALARSVAAPLRVAVRARSGVGRSTVAAGLELAGYQLERGADADVNLYVLAEVCKPEDRRAVESTDADMLVVNKADLAGWGPGGPMARARRQAAQLASEFGIPCCAFVAPLAVAALDPSIVDGRSVASLTMLVAAPADMSSPDAFVAGAHPVPTADRRRLIDTLDLFGVAHAVVTLRDEPDAGADGLRSVFRAISGLDDLVVAVDRAGMAARYRRITAACATLELRAITDAAAADFLTCDDTVVARMAAAVDVLHAAGLLVDAGDEPTAHEARALQWRRYARGPVSDLHHRCGVDIVKGSLRLLDNGVIR